MSSATAPASSSAGRLLSLLHLLRLLHVSLRQLLCLLLVLLFHLLRSCWTGVLLRQLLMLWSCFCWRFCRSWFCFAITFCCCCWYFWSSFGFPVLGGGDGVFGTSPMESNAVWC